MLRVWRHRLPPAAANACRWSDGRVGHGSHAENAEIAEARVGRGKYVHRSPPAAANARGVVRWSGRYHGSHAENAEIAEAGACCGYGAHRLPLPAANARREDGIERRGRIRSALDSILPARISPAKPGGRWAPKPPRPRRSPRANPCGRTVVSERRCASWLSESRGARFHPPCIRRAKPGCQWASSLRVLRGLRVRSGLVCRRSLLRTRRASPPERSQ
jgi:hypothetical protein